MPDPSGVSPDLLSPMPDAAAPGTADAMPASPWDASPETDLAAREAALAVKERRFFAREQLLEKGLPPDLLERLDCSSDEALARSLSVAVMAASAARGAPPLPVPPASPPPAPAAATYAQRVRLWQLDPQGYRSLVRQSGPN